MAICRFSQSVCTYIPKSIKEYKSASDAIHSGLKIFLNLLDLTWYYSNVVWIFWILLTFERWLDSVKVISASGTGAICCSFPSWVELKCNEWKIDGLPSIRGKQKDNRNTDGHAEECRTNTIEIIMTKYNGRIMTAKFWCMIGGGQWVFRRTYF